MSEMSIVESVVIEGDLARLSAAERVSYYKTVCQSVGLNPLTKPFDYIKLGGQLRLYAKKDATDQLRNMHKVSTAIQSQEVINGVYVVTTKAYNNDGREDTDIGAVNISNLKGDALANAMMKAVTKSKRRVTLSICGLGFLDETEIDTIPDAEVIPVDDVTGEIAEPEPKKKNGNGKRTWDGTLVHALVLEKLADNPQNAVAMLNLSNIDAKNTTVEQVVSWAREFRGHRDEGLEVDEAAELANASLS